MSPRLRVRAGTSLDNLVSITDLVNTPRSFTLSSDVFRGEIVVHIKGLQEEDGSVRNSEYFERKDRGGVTWSIQVQGRFLEPFSADDILFGNVFDHPLRLPWGTNAALKFMNYIDPTLEHDLLSTKPWALSPLISTMPHFAHKRLRTVPADVEEPRFPPVKSLEDSLGELHLSVASESNLSLKPLDGPTPSSSTSSLISVLSTVSGNSTKSTANGAHPAKNGKTGTFSSRSRKTQSGIKTQIADLRGASQRKAFFAQETHRKVVVFGPEDLITMDFCYGFINFTPTLSLQLPGGLSFDLMKYWDRQPVRFVCCKRKDSAEIEGDPWGRIFWCIAIDLVEDE